MITDNAVGIVARKCLRRSVVACVFCMNWTAWCIAEDSIENANSHQRWAVIVAGLPGDAEHETIFGETADQLQKWLTETLDFPADHVLRVPSEWGDDSGPLTSDRISSTFAEVKQKLREDDSLWIFLIGHGNYDGKRAWFHVAGRDPSNEDVGRWMDDVRCREQVIWLMHSSSGWFVKPLSREGRIVIAATAADDESNETEFPHALAAVSKMPIAKLDRDENKVVTIAELYTAVTAEVLRRFQSDKRLPTEHAQIDDNGDGIGTEDIQQKLSEDSVLKPGSKTKVDGDLARTTVVPYRETGSGKNKPADPD